MPKNNLVDDIIAYESGEMDDNQMLSLFARLIRSGECWSLQGHYGRVAKSLIDAGYISRSGQILKTV